MGAKGFRFSLEWFRCVLGVVGKFTWVWSCFKGLWRCSEGFAATPEVFKVVSRGVRYSKGLQNCFRRYLTLHSGSELLQRGSELLHRGSQLLQGSLELFQRVADTPEIFRIVLGGVRHSKYLQSCFRGYLTLHGG